MTSRDEQLSGRKVMRVDKETNCDVYTTNFGSVHINRVTGEVQYASISLGKNQECTEMDCQIIDGEFRISKRLIGTIQRELCSPGYCNPSNVSQTISLHDIFELLKKDTNFTVPAIAVKQKLVKLMEQKFKFNKYDKQELKEVFQVWRKPILSTK